jgi:mutator protein MutT
MPQTPTKRVEVAVGALIDFDPNPLKVLITKRPAIGVLPNFWEFPGGKREPSESLSDCVVREFLEEVSLHVQVIGALDPIEHHYPHGHVILSPFICKLISGQIRYAGVVDHKWIPIHDLPTVAFPPANTSMIAQLIAYAQNR